MIKIALLREFSQLLLKHGASLEDIIGIVYSHEELDPLTGKYKKYFDLITVNRDPVKYPEGYSYKIRYKLDLSGGKIPQGVATYTTKTAMLDEAVKLGFENRLEVLKKYEDSKSKPKSGKDFFKMLEEYYEDGSKYLLDDSACNKRDVVRQARREAKSFIKSDLIPYLKEKNIKSIQEFTTPIYSGLKIYLQAKGIKDKTINNRMNFLLRIFDYHLRNGMLEKPPYTKGTALLRITGKQIKDDAEILPIDKLKGIYPHRRLIDPVELIRFINPLDAANSFNSMDAKERGIILNDYILPFTLGVLALNTGLRNSEIGRIRREDFIGVKEKETFLLKVWNKKTEYFNRTSESKYRKIPLHPYTIEAVKIFINRKEELYGTIKDSDFLFGKSGIDNDTGEVDGLLHHTHFEKTVLLILKLIKHKDSFSDFYSSKDELIKTMKDIKGLHKELKEMRDAGKGISFYSFRKTFRTMLGLNNDLAEYYMGHKLGDNSKTTYIQINSLDNKLFVEEYAAPVITMLDKFVFYSNEDLKKIREGNESRMKKENDFMKDKILHDKPVNDVFIDYYIMKWNENMKVEVNNSGNPDSYFDKI
jgi:integrase